MKEQEPHLWNSLPDAAAWLSYWLSRDINAKDLVNIIASNGKSADPQPTIIKAVLPKNLNFAVLSMSGLRKGSTNLIWSETLKKTYGPLPLGMNYVRSIKPTFAPLEVNALCDLLIYREIEIGVVHNIKTDSPDELTWLMPYGTTHIATIETCGINREDLIELEKKLSMLNNNKVDFLQVEKLPAMPIKTSAHKIRKNMLDVPIDKAIAEARSNETNAVYLKLKDLALNSESPFTGEIDKKGALFYTDNDDIEKFTKGALGKRLNRRR